MRSRRHAWWALAACWMLLALAACSTSGQGFRSSSLWRIVPGQTTVAQASDILGAEPVDIYRHLDGSLIARWAHSMSLVTDAAYFRQELWLEFGSDGTFEKVVRKINLPPGTHAGLASATATAPPAAATPSVSPAAHAATPGAAPAAAASRTAPSAAWAQPLDEAAVVYPLAR